MKRRKPAAGLSVDEALSRIAQCAALRDHLADD
jgi:hypothetical protein